MAEKQDDLKKVRELIALMKENDLVEIEVAGGDNKIHLKRPGAIAPAASMQAVPAVPPAPAPAASVAAPAPAAAPAPEASNLIEIKSPIVGTFYAAPSPDSEPYVKIGDQVDAETVVCIVEAMKVMNEIKAETHGIIVEVSVKDGQSVEYGQVLFRVRP
jgi:acetyl-CoA carboxylase biotin carboxyl carrier protein